MEINSTLILLPTEIRQEIFKNLDNAALFKCLLVDRQCCREIVPILWEAPLSKILNKSRIDREERQKRLVKVVNVYLGSFTKETWEFLRANGISRPRNIRTPAFNYAAFLRHYEITAVSYATVEWLQQKSVIPTVKQMRKREALRKSLCALFVEQAQTIRSFHNDLSLESELWVIDTPKEHIERIGLDLRELRVSGITLNTDLLSLFENLAEFCRSIRGITLANLRSFSENIVNEATKKTAIGLKSVIEAQSELQWLQLFQLTAANTKVIINSLHASSKTLRAIKFFRIDFNLLKKNVVIEGLRSCANLLCLDFTKCKAIEQQSWIETAQSFKKLEFLTITISLVAEFPVEFIKKVIETSSLNLKYFQLRQETFTQFSGFGEKIVKEILPFILLYSRNLRVFGVQDLNMDSIVSLLNSCRKLEHLEVYSKNLDDTLDILATKLPPSIYSLRIHKPLNHSNISRKPLIEFLKTTRNHLRLLSIHINDFNGIIEKTAKDYGVKFITSPIEDGVYPDYFPKF
ncbi:6464_t:CDS:2 [Ambispora leptoticha]|uniref:6464_t:CDS:1 n=1 Tax=Ambispora leptoticha TaxID=144679 RepID=A0A9N8W1F8_9GLOM|nr:6464_t:CDS:2 [Ambispora leptoticha]